jgi:hypothetical protein
VIGTVDLVLVAAAGLWLLPLVALALVLARAVRRPPSGLDERLARVDREFDAAEHRRRAAAQERAAAAALRGDRRVVAELRPGVRQGVTRS